MKTIFLIEVNAKLWRNSQVTHSLFLLFTLNENGRYNKSTKYKIFLQMNTKRAFRNTNQFLIWYLKLDHCLYVHLSICEYATKIYWTNAKQSLYLNFEHYYRNSPIYWYKFCYLWSLIVIDFNVFYVPRPIQHLKYR